VPADTLFSERRLLIAALKVEEPASLTILSGSSVVFLALLLGVSHGSSFSVNKSPFQAGSTHGNAMFANSNSSLTSSTVALRPFTSKVTLVSKSKRLMILSFSVTEVELCFLRFYVQVADKRGSIFIEL
jgi:hypothetical protein